MDLENIMLSEMSQTQANTVRLYAAYQAAVHGIFQARVLEWVAIAFSDT